MQSTERQWYVWLICISIAQWNAPCRMLLRRGPTLSKFALNRAEVALIHNLSKFNQIFNCYFVSCWWLEGFKISRNSSYLAIRSPVSWHASGIFDIILRTEWFSMECNTYIGSLISARRWPSTLLSLDVILVILTWVPQKVFKSRDKARRTFSVTTTTMPPRFGLLMRHRQGSTSAIPPIPPPLDGVDTTIASTDYAQKCREIMDLYRDLRNLGYDILFTFTVLFYHLNRCVRSVHTSFDLPRVVVIGGQSSKRPEIVSYATSLTVIAGGKSSLVEAVSGVSIPIILPGALLILFLQKKINVPRDSGTCTRHVCDRTVIAFCLYAP
jgi:hypothetical protein